MRACTSSSAVTNAPFTACLSFARSREGWTCEGLRVVELGWMKMSVFACEPRA